jgi:hypothetical protein
VLFAISQAGTAFSPEIDLGNALQHFERRSFRVVLFFSLSTFRHRLLGLDDALGLNPACPKTVLITVLSEHENKKGSQLA